MNNENPYSKREQDLINNTIHEKLDRLLEDVKISREERHDFEKSVKPLFKAVSDNSGEILKLSQSVQEIRKISEDNSKAGKLIDEITTSWKVGKAVVGFVVSVLLFFVAIKTIIYGGFKEGLLAIKNLIF